MNYFNFFYLGNIKMPCTTGRSKHHLCATGCEEACPCIVRTAYSCQPACDDKPSNCCCCPTFAFGRIIPVSGLTGTVNGVTGEILYGLQQTVSNQGIAGITGGGLAGTTGLFTVFFRDGTFNKCPDDLPPSVTVAVCNSPTAPGLPEQITIECLEVSNEYTVVHIKRSDNDNALDLGFELHAMQSSGKICH